jgi:imidazole glycerol-phosphate synthase subunit HisH
VNSARHIAIIDYGAGNVPSVERALQKLGATSKCARQASDLDGAAGIILPGVGHYATIIHALDECDLRLPLLASIRRGVPFLGICLGLQALYTSSEEAPSLAGLNLLAGAVRSLPRSVKLPHMGWNCLHIQRPSVLLAGITASDYFYFAHTFAAITSAGEVVATSDHGTSFAAVVERDNIFATQFHPEKSGAPGTRLFNNFVSLVNMSTFQ